MTPKEEFYSIIEEIRDFTKTFYHPGYAFYRGHSQFHYGLTPTLYRQKLIKHKDYDQLENNLFSEFTAYCYDLFETEKDWDILYLMQHNGIPTRLLDWTESLGAALFFALDSEKTPLNPSIWVLDPYTLNKITEKNKFTEYPNVAIYNPTVDFSFSYVEGFTNKTKSNLRFDAPKALYPLKNNRRMHAQKGLFTIHGNNTSDLNVQAPGCLKEFRIPPACIDTAIQFLEIAGIDHFTIYPDFEGLRKKLYKNYSLT